MKHNVKLDLNYISGALHAAIPV